MARCRFLSEMYVFLPPTKTSRFPLPYVTGVTAQTNPPDQNIPRGYSGLAHFIPRGLNQASLEYTPPAQINPPIEIAEKITFIIEKTHIMK